MKKAQPQTNGFAIEKNVPIPSKGMKPTYPWREMKVGDCIFIPNVTNGSLSQSIDRAKWQMGAGVQFTRRTVDGGVRVWRIA